MEVVVGAFVGKAGWSFGEAGGDIVEYCEVFWVAVGCHGALKVSRGAIIIVEVAKIIHRLCSLERHLGCNTHGGSIVVVKVDSGHILCIEVLLWHGFNRMWSGRSWHWHGIWNHPMPQSTHVPVNLILCCWMLIRHLGVMTSGL